MDKLNADNWLKSFGKIEEKIIHRSERYTEVALSVEEPGLASVQSLMIQVPGIELTRVLVHPVNTLVLADDFEGERLESAFLLSGQANSIFSMMSKPASLETNMHAFQYSPSFTAEHKILTDDFHAMHLTVNPVFFKSLLYSANTGEMDFLSNSFERKETFQSMMYLQPRMLEIIRLLLTCRFKGLTRYMFIESKLLELLALQIEQAGAEKMVKDPFSRSDKEKLAAMRNFIENNFLEPLSLPKLCRMFTLNEFKVKKGYKQLFNTTVFGHIHTLRMNKARQLLEQKVMNISEIADFIGYENIGSFSAEFKKRFGYSPSKLSYIHEVDVLNIR